MRGIKLDDKTKNIRNDIRRQVTIVRNLLTDFEAIVVDDSTTALKYRKALKERSSEAQDILNDVERALITLLTT